MHLFQFGPTRDIRTENRVSQEQRQAAVRQKQTGQLGGHDVEQIQRGSGPLGINESTAANTTSTAASTAFLSVADQIRAARVAAFSNPQQSEQSQQRVEISVIKDKVVPFSDNASSSTSSSSSSRVKTAATTSASSDVAVTIEDDDTLAAKRFEHLDTRGRQPYIIDTSIDAYNALRNERATNAVARGQNINNEEALVHNERMERFEPLGRQLANKAIEFTQSAMSLAQQGSSLNQPTLHQVARRYDDLAAIADKGVASFKTKLKGETISDRDLNEVTGSYQELIAREESIKGHKTYAEKGIQFSEAAQHASSSAFEIDSTAVAIPYDQLADYCFRMVENPAQITAQERKHYEPMVAWASQSLEARSFGSTELANALDKNIQIHEALARCTERSEQSSNPQVQLILSQAGIAYRTARSSRNNLIQAKSSELSLTKRLAAATSDEEVNRALLVSEQNEEYKKEAARGLQASSSSSSSASLAELATNADGYEEVAGSLEKAASSQEAIAALPDIPSKVKSQKPLKQRAQEFLDNAQKLHAEALEQLQRNEASAVEDTLNRARLQLNKVDNAVEAARTAAAKAAGTSI